MTNFIELIEEYTNTETANEIAMAVLSTTIVAGLIYCVISLI